MLGSYFEEKKLHKRRAKDCLGKISTNIEKLAQFFDYLEDIGPRQWFLFLIKFMLVLLNLIWFI